MLLLRLLPPAAPQSFNALASLPVLRCPALTRLDVAHNQLAAPPDLAHLPQLAELHLGYNGLTAGPPPLPNGGPPGWQVRFYVAP